MKIFGYRNVAYIPTSSADIDYVRANGWILKDSSGNEVYSPSSGNRLLDLGNASCREWVANRIRYSVTELASLDGVFADNTCARLNPYYISAWPINPRTGNPYTDQEWRDDTLALVQKVKEKVGKLYIANGAGLHCGSGTVSGFWANQQLAEPLLNAVDGVLLEGFIRWENEPWRSTANWKKDVDFLKLVNEKGKIAIAWTICSGTLPSGATQYQVAMYGYATYLLAASGDKSYFRAKGYDEGFYNATRISVGFPLEEYHVRGDAPVYEREFSKALVLVNPTDNSFTLSLNRNYETIEGQPVSSVVLPAKSGLILIKKP
jgi:hypothetical protein